MLRFGRSCRAHFPFSLFPFPNWRSTVAVALMCMAVLALAPAAAAQSCAMCYDSAKQQSAQAASALNTGILILLLPSVLIFGGVLVTAFRRREESDSQS